MNETLLSLSWWLERIRWLKEHKGAGLASLLAVLLIALAVRYQAALLEGLFQYIREHPARATIVVLSLLAIAATWAAFLYRTLWSVSLIEVCRFSDLQRELEIERAKVLKLETVPKPPADPLQYQSRRIITYLVNACEAPPESIALETGESREQVDAQIRSLILTLGFISRRTEGGKHFYSLTELGERYVTEFDIPIVNRGTMKPSHEN
jgi:hypothetical protein